MVLLRCRHLPNVRRCLRVRHRRRLVGSFCAIMSDGHPRGPIKPQTISKARYLADLINAVAAFAIGAACASYLHMLKWYYGGWMAWFGDPPAGNPAYDPVRRDWLTADPLCSGRGGRRINRRFWLRRAGTDWNPLRRRARSVSGLIFIRPGPYYHWLCAGCHRLFRGVDRYILGVLSTADLPSRGI